MATVYVDNIGKTVSTELSGHLDLANEQLKLLHNVEPHSVSFVGKREKDSLVCGDVDGKFKTLFTKVENINTKSGPFDFLLCVGDFFGSSADSWTPYKDGKLSVPIATYVLGPSTVSHGALYPDMNGGELAPNVSYLVSGQYCRRRVEGTEEKWERKASIGIQLYLDSICRGEWKEQKRSGRGRQVEVYNWCDNERGANEYSKKFLDSIVEESGRNRGRQVEYCRGEWKEQKRSGRGRQVEVYNWCDSERGANEYSKKFQVSGQYCRGEWKEQKRRKRGLFTTSSGLKIAYVSGIETNSKESPQEHTFVEADVVSVRDICYKGKPSFRGVDILVTSVWPKDIVHINVDLRQTADSWLLSWLATQIKPRYHFCASKTVYYERPPYSNFNSSGDTAIHATRFIALAKVGNEGKQKWLYAASLEPIDKMSAKELYQQTTDQTECPYSGNMLSPHINKKPEEPTQFFYDMNQSDDGDNRRKRSRKNDDGPERKQRPVFDQATCWFCLQSSDVEKHLVISIGDEAYLALAKGGLVPEHLLILPVTHHQSLSDVPEAECAETQGFQLDEIPTHSKLEQIAPPGTPYFYVELPSGEKLFHRVKKNFPLQFGREVLASSALLDMEDRADWRDCKISKEEETDLAKQFRNDFKEFDFTV
uniref:CWF19-like protein 1 n=1 Tax=Timema monikensis TaxID=170555 RepID=A0A7R9EIL5_9NEOP|nr:unnamed protein product [Timema monikensis]